MEECQLRTTSEDMKLINVLSDLCKNFDYYFSKPIYNVQIELKSDWNYLAGVVGPHRMADIIDGFKEYTGSFIVTDKNVMKKGFKEGLETRVASIDLLEGGQIEAIHNKKHKSLVDGKYEEETNVAITPGGILKLPLIKLSVHAHFSDGKMLSYVKWKKGYFKIV